MSEEDNYNENITTILKACYNNGYYYPSTYSQPRPLHNILTVGALGLGAGLLGSTLLGAIGRSDAEGQSWLVKTRWSYFFNITELLYFLNRVKKGHMH